MEQASIFNEIQKYYQNERSSDSVYSRNNLPKIKDARYEINFDEKKSIGTYWIALYMKDDNATYPDSFRKEHIPKEIRKFVGRKNITTNIYRI